MYSYSRQIVKTSASSGNRTLIHTSSSFTSAICNNIFCFLQDSTPSPPYLPAKIFTLDQLTVNLFMDSVVHHALEEICIQSINGLRIKTLWSNLNSSLSLHGLSLSSLPLKRALWANIVDIPGLQFECKGAKIEKSSSLTRDVEKCEHVDVKIVADEKLRNCSLGMYDIKSSDITQVQRRTLERLATTRSEGIAQSELAKELGIKPENFFYVLEKLECRGLISRQSMVIRTKKISSNLEPKNNHVSTNMLHLHRYAKPLGCQQKLEITKEERHLNGGEFAANGDGFYGKIATEDILEKDYLPALKAICDKLDKATRNVLAVSDIKRDLGYCGASSGHRAWRNICQRLKASRVVEEFTAKEKDKKLNCLRLLKKFAPQHFDAKKCAHKSNEQNAEQSLKLGRKSHVTEQVMELPIEQQIYDMIDAEGSKGITITEVCKRFGIPNKQFHRRLDIMVSRFGMHMLEERCNKGKAYRVFTSGNFNPEASNSFSSTQIVVQETNESNSREWNVKSLDSLVSGDVPMEDLQIVKSTPENQQMELSTPSSVLIKSTPEPKPRRCISYQTYDRRTLGSTNSLREQRILKMLQVPYKPELHRRLESFEKDKNTLMDRKTLKRTLNKLQLEGHCKCIHMSVPLITNCSRTRTTEVVLHPSAYDLTPELLGQIHDRMRSFQWKIHQHDDSRLNKVQEVPELNTVQRIPYHTKSDLQSELSEVRRINGFVLAKMVRAKLLHSFLWEYISSSPGWNNDMHNPHSSCKLFEADVAINTMTIEIFLQIAGSTQKFEDMIEKFKRGLRLSDLSEQEFRSLKDTRAIGQLSLLIDILRRLKLIGLVDGGTRDKPPHTSLSYALELKPYLEEPASIVVSSLGFLSADIRPQKIRHDFVLSNRKAVDDYWKTLEYCYSAADTEAARNAFPGSVVHEISSPKSWASVRLMTAEQRAELLKRVGNEDPDKNLSFRECNEIAKDLNLTMEQVLRVHYDRRHQKLSRLYGKKQGVHRLESTNISSLLKRKRSSGRKSSKHDVDEVLLDRQLCTRGQYDEEQYNQLTPDDDEYSLHYDHEYEEAGEDVEPNEDEDNIGFKCALSRLKRKRQRKFSWTELADRKLVIEYARHRAALGANFHRTNWASLSNLPAPPDTCRRRMAILNTSVFRKSIMRLCNKLTDRYAKYLEKFQHNKLSTGDSRGMIRDYPVNEDNHHNISDHSGNVESEDVWDNFDEPDIQTAVNDVLRCKRTAKLEAYMRIEDAEDDELLSSPRSQEEEGCGIKPKFDQRSGSNRLPTRYCKFLREGISVYKRAYKSVAVSNAIELFKLIFLSTSTAPVTTALLAETLRQYSEHDLFAAFNYLRAKKIMIGGSCNNPFELSQHFLRSISLSPFPVNTGKRAVKFAHWFHEKEKELTEEGIDIPEDLQCGDLMHLCSLISQGELSITPLLPDEGVGEVEDAKTFKRKLDDPELCSSEKNKKMRFSIPGEGEIISRREKGFPGIKSWLNLSSFSRMDAFQLFKEKYAQAKQVTEQKGGTRSGMDDCDLLIHPNKPNCSIEVHGSGKSLHLSDSSVESPWEAMASFAHHLSSSCSSHEHEYSFHPNLFKKACVAIRNAGDQGLSIIEVSKIMNAEVEMILDITTEVLEAFGRAFKVNTFDSEHMVDSLYRSKYFSIPVTGLHQHPKSVTLRESKKKKDDDNFISDRDGHKAGFASSMESKSSHEVHRISIRTLPEDVSEPQGSVSIDRTSTSAKCSEQDTLELHPTSFDSYKPILPWINGDGTVNELIYKGLVRRVLGIIMQNPGILEEDIIKKLVPILNPQYAILLLGDVSLSSVSLKLPLPHQRICYSKYLICVYNYYVDYSDILQWKIYFRAAGKC